MTPAIRPAVDPLVLAQLIQAAPGRVRKRLEQNPAAAQEWDWQSAAAAWSVQAGEETVHLLANRGVVDSQEGVRCTCLLSPRCFHVLACVSLLVVAEGAAVETEAAEYQSAEIEPIATEASPLPKPRSEAGERDWVPVTAEMRVAAEQVCVEVSGLIRVGGRRADLLRQSGLLRAAHRCRAAGLVHLGNTVLQIVESIRQQRESRDTADAQTLAVGMAQALQRSEPLLRNAQVRSALIGQSRRQFDSCAVGKLAGLCAEPVLTLSGYSGIVVYLQSLDTHVAAGPGRLFTLNQLRPGEPRWVEQAYLGGIDLGNQTWPARELSRGQLLVQNLTVSRDGRLGKGATTRWVMVQRPLEQGWEAEVPFAQGRFGTSLSEQLDTVFSAAAIDPEERAAGWDLVAFDAQVLGASGAALGVRVPESSQMWKLRIALDVPSLPFRENLSLLARCPGLPLRCLGRLRLHAAGEVDLLAIAAGRVVEHGGPASGDAMYEPFPQPLPKLCLPSAWRGVCNVGCDRLERQSVEGMQRGSVELAPQPASEPARGAWEGAARDGLEPLRRRQIALASGGRLGVADVGSLSHRRDREALLRRHQYTAAELLDLTALAARLPDGACGTTPSLATVFLANHLYLHRATSIVERLSQPLH